MITFDRVISNPFSRSVSKQHLPLNLPEIVGGISGLFSAFDLSFDAVYYQDIW